MPPIPRTSKRTPPRRAAAKKAADVRKVVDGEAPPTPPTPVSEDNPPVNNFEEAQEFLRDATGNAPPKPRKGSLEARLKEVFAGTAILPAMAGDSYSAFIIATRSDKFAHDLAEIAAVNPRVKRIIEGFLDGGAYGGVFFSGAALFLPIAWAYGILPRPPVDPFAPFYPALPPGVVPRQSRKTSDSTPNRSVGDSPGQSRARRAPGSAPGPASVGHNPAGDGPPPGVVTVPPGAHPPVNPAAGQ
jgi:hypothetical protein